MVTFARSFMYSVIFKSGVVFLWLFALVSCGSNKPLKQAMDSEKWEDRLRTADDYYEKGDFYRAIQLYEIVVNEILLKEDLAEIYFKLANCYYGQGDFAAASSLFNTFYISYPDNINAEQAYFYKAECTYALAEDDFRLDPSNLIQAMKEYQDFLITYPEGEFAKQAYLRVERIRIVVEKKELENGKLYLKIGEYKAAIEEFNRFLEDYPSSELAEEAYYYLLQVRYELAKHSVPDKQVSRYDVAFAEYNYFLEKYPESAFREPLTELTEKAKKEFKKINNNE